MQISLLEIDDWKSEDFLQSPFWARFKESFGWTSRAFRAECTGPDIAFDLSVLVRPLRFGYAFAYVPHGPAVDLPAGERSRALECLARALREKLGRKCAFVRFDPAWHELERGALPTAGEAGDGEGKIEEGASAAMAKARPSRPRFSAPLRKGADVQPPDTVLLDLGRTEDELLAGMKPKWRYNVKLALKKNVAVSQEGAGSIDAFYDMYRTTARRDGIALHPKRYYARLFDPDLRRSRNPGGEPIPMLWVARHEGQALAAIITVFYGRQAVYLYGASSDEKRNLMPAYALQWAAIRAARAAGCSCYDFYGIPPADDPAHAMAGLYRFKTGFGGAIARYSGAWDYAYSPAAYLAFRAAESGRLYWHKTLKKKLARL